MISEELPLFLTVSQWMGLILLIQSFRVLNVDLKVSFSALEDRMPLNR